MRKYLLISHGRFAEGCIDTLKLFIGERCRFKPICAYIDDMPVNEKLKEALADIADSDELLVCSDMMGGSVNQVVLPLLNRPQTFIVTGVNMPLLMELADLEEDEPLSDEIIRETIDICKNNSIVYMNDKIKRIDTLAGDE